MNKQKVTPLPLTLKCPIGGEEWPATSYNTSTESGLDRLMKKHIHFSCPAEHYFTLSAAAKSKMFTPDQVARILKQAEKTAAKYRGKVDQKAD